MESFVAADSIVRKIWGKSDTILFIFAGSAAEFALNKAVDWLYFTGKLPADPLGRLFSTVSYARRIIFSPMEEAHAAIDTMRHIHAAVENKRGDTIPDWAYRDVLFMLIHYSIAAHELLERKLSLPEKGEVFDVFYRVGTRMGVQSLPSDYNRWVVEREEHLQHDLQKSQYTTDLFRQYRKHLGGLRYFILLQGQKLVVPERVKELLGFYRISILALFLPFYKLIRMLKADWFLKNLFLPAAYKAQIKALDMYPRK